MFFLLKIKYTTTVYMKTNNLIEKNVFQSWKTKQLHPVIQEKVDRQKARNPGYTFHLFDDNDMDLFVNTVYSGRIAEAYNRLNIVVAKVDFWRYLVLYHYGGVYVDMDSEIECSLDDDLLQPGDEAVFSQEGNPGFFLQWGLIAKKGHPVLKRTIEVVTNNIEQKKSGMIETTGPGAFTKALQELYEEFYHQKIPLVTMSRDDNTYQCLPNSKFRIVGTDFNGLYIFFLLQKTTKHFYTTPNNTGCTKYKSNRFTKKLPDNA